MSINEILFSIPVFPQSLDQAIAADRIPWFQLTKELSQILRPGDRFEKSRKIGDEKGGRRLLQPVQVSHTSGDRLECRLNLLVGIIKQGRKNGRLFPASHLGKEEPAFLTKAGERGCGGSDKYDRFIPFLGEDRKKIGFASRNNSRYLEPSFLVLKSLEKAFELFCLFEKIKTHENPIIQDEFIEERELSERLIRQPTDLIVFSDHIE
jgi:hypothetical protein